MFVDILAVLRRVGSWEYVFRRGVPSKSSIRFSRWCYRVCALRAGRIRGGRAARESCEFLALTASGHDMEALSTFLAAGLCRAEDNIRTLAANKWIHSSQRGEHLPEDNPY